MVMELQSRNSHVLQKNNGLYTASLVIQHCITLAIAIAMTVATRARDAKLSRPFLAFITRLADFLSISQAKCRFVKKKRKGRKCTTTVIDSDAQCPSHHVTRANT
jgi:hypothetical protein